MPDPAETDDALMARYAETGDPSAYAALFQRYAQRLHGYFLRSVGDAEAARDLTQQCFLHVHRARRDFHPGSPFRPWVYTIAANLRREHFRRRSRKPEAAWDPDRHGVPSVDPEASTSEQRVVRRALLELPEGQREVLVLHWYEGLSLKEVADVLGLSHSAAKVRAHRAYGRLRELLA